MSAIKRMLFNLVDMAFWITVILIALLLRDWIKDSQPYKPPLVMVASQ